MQFVLLNRLKTAPVCVSVTVRTGAGAWTFSHQAYYTVTDEMKAVLESAVANTYNGTSTFEAVQTLASQVVAGTNYAFLCKETPVCSEEPTNRSILTVYVDLDGNAKLTHEEAIDPTNIKTLDNLTDIESGSRSGWTVLGTDEGVTLPQTVARTNYRILAYGTKVTAEPRTDLYGIDVFEGLDATAQVYFSFHKHFLRFGIFTEKPCTP